ncbi:MAG: hypothetical protein V3U75_13430 [Methylococcaceae bacterium]
MPDLLDIRDIRDIRDLIERFEQLNEDEVLDEFDKDEQSALANLLGELKGNGGDEQWEGDWYPITLINDSYFEDSRDELVKDCYSLDALDIPAFITLTIDYDMLQQDYSEIEYEGETYWYR